MARPYILLLASFAVSAAPAGAQSLAETNQRIVLAGQAPAACVIANPVAQGGANASFTSQSATSGQITIAQLVDPFAATALPSSIALELPVICNTSHRLTVRSMNGGLARGGQFNNRGTGGFSEFLPYRVTVDWGGQNLSQNSDAGRAQISLDRPAQGFARIGFATTAGGGPLVAGQYTDALIIELAPAN